MDPIAPMTALRGLAPVRGSSPGRGADPPEPTHRGPGPAVTVQLSAEALQAVADAAAREEELVELRRRLPSVQRAAEEERRAAEEEERLRSGVELTEEERQTLDTLERWDREIRLHEAAHIAAAGGLAGGATFETVTGPDGRSYVVGGSVKVRVSDAGSPEANAAQLRKLKAAATAVSDPSAADLRVAGKAERRLQAALRSRAASRYEAQRGS